MVDAGRALLVRTASLDAACTCMCSVEAVEGVLVSGEEAGGSGGFVVGFMIGDSLLFCAASRTVTDPRDGGRAVVCPVTIGCHSRKHDCVRVAAAAVDRSRE